MKKSHLALGMVVLLCSATTLAQGFRLGADAVGMVPTGDYSNNYGVGIGGLVRMEAISPGGFVVTFRTGYIQHLTKIARDDLRTTKKLDEVPILLGTRFYTVARIYAAIEAGVSSSGVTITTATSNISDSSLTGTAALGIGILLGPIDLQFSIRSVDLYRMKNTLEYGSTLGFFINL